MSNADRCVCCGEIIPEGRMVCPNCEEGSKAKRLIPDGKKVTLNELPCGTLFAFGDDCIAVKSEYRCNNGLIEAFIIDSGEQFWGGVHTAKEQNELMVQPLAIDEMDAVEVVRCKDCRFSAQHDPYDPMECVKWATKWGVVYTTPDGYCHKGERKDK